MSGRWGNLNYHWRPLNNFAYNSEIGLAYQWNYRYQNLWTADNVNCIVNEIISGNVI